MYPTATSQARRAAERFAPGLEALLRPIGELREDPANVRRHPERNRRAIEASLRVHDMAAV